MNAFEKLDALYAALPTIPCKRKCQKSCGPVLIPRIEAARLERKRGFLQLVSTFEVASRTWLPPPEIIMRNFIGVHPERDGLCVFLDRGILGGCTCYKIRPSVCRLFGMVDNEFMRCPFGCVPTRWVTDAEARALDLAIIEVQKEWEREK